MKIVIVIAIVTKEMMKIVTTNQNQKILIQIIVKTKKNQNLKMKKNRINQMKKKNLKKIHEKMMMKMRKKRKKMKWKIIIKFKMKK